MEDNLFILKDLIASTQTPLRRAEMDLLFELHNTLRPTAIEHGRRCSSCQKRVHTYMSNYLNICSLRVSEFLEDVPSHGKMTTEQRQQMINLHNELFPDHPEQSKNCTGCRSRMHQRLTKFIQ